LPKDLPNPPTYRKTNPADRAILIYAVYSDALPLYRVDDYAYTIMAQRISQIAGVSQVDIAGQQQYAVHVQVNPTALASRGIAFEDVRNALAAATLEQAKQSRRSEPDGDARHQRSAVQRQCILQRYCGLPKWSASACQGCRSRN
jgi:multidrug efflux pump subunit AcrB